MFLDKIILHKFGICLLLTNNKVSYLKKKSCLFKILFVTNLYLFLKFYDSLTEKQENLHPRTRNKEKTILNSWILLYTIPGISW